MLPDMIEIGSFIGESTIIFARNFKHVSAIDPFMDNYDPEDMTSNFNFDEVKEQVRILIGNYHECDGDVFSLRLDSINFVPHKIVLVDGSGDVDEWYSYNINVSIKNDSPVFNTIDLGDFEDVETLYGQIEGCVENMLNDTIYFNYGIAVNHCLLVGIYE